MTSLISRTLTATLLGLPLLAAAHVGPDAAAHHGLAAGFLHPFTGADHLLAMLVVGVWSALTARRPWLAPASFASMVLLGALLASAGVVLPAIEPMIAASLLLLGLLLAARVVWPGVAVVLVTGGFALFHGAAHGTELSGAGALTGMVLATMLLHLCGIGVGLLLRNRHRWWPRSAGLATSLFGLLLLSGVAG